MTIGLKRPEPEDYGFVNNDCFDGEQSGWCVEGGEEAYEEALLKYQFMYENGLGEEDMRNDISLPNEI